MPTARLRFVVRAETVVRAEGEPVFGDGGVSALRGDLVAPGRVLQQWWAPDLPGYMADPAVGEWRDVPTVE